MEENKDNFGFGETMPEPDEMNDLHSIEDDSDTLEPFDDATEHREIDADNPEEIRLWAEKFQISENDLKAAIVLKGNSVREIKKYLSV